MASGKLIFVTGYSGAGKSTLVRAALGAVGNLKYLKTTTTRPPRPEEVVRGSMEYEFVSPEEYAARQAASRHWDHTPVHEYSYGADVDSVNQKLTRGIDIICCPAPDLDIIDQMSNLYAVRPVVIWVDTPLQVANSRLQASGDEDRMHRIDHRLQSEANAIQVKQLASTVFEPVHDLRVDIADFIQMVQQILSSDLISDQSK